jgi:hypothetical protein
MNAYAPPNIGPTLAQMALGIPREFREARERSTFQRTLADLASSGQPIDAAALGRAALMSGNAQLGLAAAQLAATDEDRRWRRTTDDRNFAAQRQDAAFQQGIATRQQGFQERAAERADQPNRELRDRAAAANLTPGTPEYQRFMERGGQAPPRLAGSDIDRLSNVGGRLSDAERFNTTFRPEFAGWRFSAIGNAANELERRAGIAAAPGSGAWWQEYDRYRNVIRNDLFGSALTVNEQRAFDAADINPGMTPEAIRANLEIQRRAAEGAARRIAAARVQNGDDPEVVAQAMGIPLARLGIQPRAARPAAAAPAGGTQAQPATPPAQQYREGQRIRNPATGEERVWQGGQWVPVTQ